MRYGNREVREAAVALIIVLAFIVLLTGLVVAFFSRGVGERTQSSSNSHNIRADILALTGAEMVVADLKQEIHDNSSSGPSGTYTPKSAKDAVPKRTENPVAGGTDLIPNLIRRSVRSDSLPVPSRASSVNSESDPARNKRRVTKARWNAHYLIPRDPAIPAATISTEPVPEFIAPDWVFVTDEGPKVLATADSKVLGRYAYAVYDEGGLLDVNVAGYPFRKSGATYKPGLQLRDIGRKGRLSFAKLNVDGLLTESATSDLIGFRNFATVRPKNSFGNYDFDDPAISPSTATRYLDLVLNNANGFRTASDVSVAPAGPTVFYRTDQIFTTRQSLIAYRRAVNFSQDALQHLGTFSRGRNKPTWSGSETRLKERFRLSRFDAFADPENKQNDIKRYFGLQWVKATDSTKEHWKYIGAEGRNDELQASIHLLNAGAGQDPDLSVLLGYAYGLSEGAEPGEVLSIIASLIDLRDTNTDTTWIEYSGGGENPTAKKAFGGDEGGKASDPMAPTPPAVKDFAESFRSVGEIGCALKNGTTSVNLAGAGADSVLLDLFAAESAELRASVVSLNTRSPAVLAALIAGTFEHQSSWDSTDTNDYVKDADGSKAAADIIKATQDEPALGRADIAKLTAKIGTSVGPTSDQDRREVIARALADVAQTRTWNVMIDVIAQSGRYPPAASGVADFIAEAEKRYWLHIAIDRFTGDVIDQQLEAVYE